ncbi:MAG: glucose-6-phosphate isomerase, partial [Erysipelotrichaceae bacterium]|nr:glucose-6-phosphate isomerase [Erysipelotrichaceae bacterium]
MKLQLNNLITADVLKSYREKVAKIDAMIDQKSGLGNDYLGWADWPINYDKEEFKRILEDARYVREHFDILVVCGIGGSYLGA